jgi:hypothetical protein
MESEESSKNRTQASESFKSDEDYADNRQQNAWIQTNTSDQNFAKQQSAYLCLVIAAFPIE